MNQSKELFSNCNDIEISAVMALGSIYNLGIASDDSSCDKDGISFFCNAITALCGNGSGSSMLNEQCIQVRDYDCTVEWRITKNLLLNVSVPDCDSFDNGTNLTFSAVAPTQTCPNDYDVFCNTLCLPVCGDISPFSDTINHFTFFWSGMVNLISGIGKLVDIVAFYFKRKTM